MPTSYNLSICVNGWQNDRDIQISERSIDVLSISRHSFSVKARGQIVRRDVTRCRRRTYDGRGKTTTVLAWLVSVTLCIFSGRSCLHLCTMHAACKHAGYIWMRIMCTYVHTWLSAKWRRVVTRGDRACSRTKCSAITTTKQWITSCYVPSTRWVFRFYRLKIYFHFPWFDISPFLSRCCHSKKYECYRFARYFERLRPITATRNDHFARSTRSTVNGISANMTRGANYKIGERKKVSSRAQT